MTKISPIKINLGLASVFLCLVTHVSTERWQRRCIRKTSHTVIQKGEGLPPATEPSAPVEEGRWTEEGVCQPVTYLRIPDGSLCFHIPRVRTGFGSVPLLACFVSVFPPCLLSEPCS